MSGPTLQRLEMNHGCQNGTQETPPDVCQEPMQVLAENWRKCSGQPKEMFTSCHSILRFPAQWTRKNSAGSCSPRLLGAGVVNQCRTQLTRPIFYISFQKYPCLDTELGPIRMHETGVTSPKSNEIYPEKWAPKRRKCCNNGDVTLENRSVQHYSRVQVRVFTGTRARTTCRQRPM